MDLSPAPGTLKRVPMYCPFYVSLRVRNEKAGRREAQLWCNLPVDKMRFDSLFEVWRSGRTPAPSTLSKPSLLPWTRKLEFSHLDYPVHGPFNWDALPLPFLSTDMALEQIEHYGGSTDSDVYSSSENGLQQSPSTFKEPLLGFSSNSSPSYTNSLVYGRLVMPCHPGVYEMTARARLLGEEWVWLGGPGVNSSVEVLAKKACFAPLLPPPTPSFSHTMLSLTSHLGIILASAKYNALLSYTYLDSHHAVSQLGSEVSSSYSSPSSQYRGSASLSDSPERRASPTPLSNFECINSQPVRGGVQPLTPSSHFGCGGIVAVAYLSALLHASITSTMENSTILSDAVGKESSEGARGALAHLLISIPLLRSSSSFRARLLGRLIGVDTNVSTQVLNDLSLVPLSAMDACNPVPSFSENTGESFFSEAQHSLSATDPVKGEPSVTASPQHLSAPDYKHPRAAFLLLTQWCCGSHWEVGVDDGPTGLQSCVLEGYMNLVNVVSPALISPPVLKLLVVSAAKATSFSRTYFAQSLRALYSKGANDTCASSFPLYTKTLLDPVRPVFREMAVDFPPSSETRVSPNSSPFRPSNPNRISPGVSSLHLFAHQHKCPPFITDNKDQWCGPSSSVFVLQNPCHVLSCVFRDILCEWTGEILQDSRRAKSREVLDIVVLDELGKTNESGGSSVIVSNNGAVAHPIATMSHTSMGPFTPPAPHTPLRHLSSTPRTASVKHRGKFKIRALNSPFSPITQPLSPPASPSSSRSRLSAGGKDFDDDPFLSRSSSYAILAQAESICPRQIAFEPGELDWPDKYSGSGGGGQCNAGGFEDDSHNENVSDPPLPTSFQTSNFSFSPTSAHTKTLVRQSNRMLASSAHSNIISFTKSVPFILGLICDFVKESHGGSGSSGGRRSKNRSSTVYGSAFSLTSPVDGTFKPVLTASSPGGHRRSPGSGGSSPTSDHGGDGYVTPPNSPHRDGMRGGSPNSSPPRGLKHVGLGASSSGQSFFPSLWKGPALAIALALVSIPSVPEGLDTVAPHYCALLEAASTLAHTGPYLFSTMLGAILSRWPSSNSDNVIYLLSWIGSVLSMIGSGVWGSTSARITDVSDVPSSSPVKALGSTFSLKGLLFSPVRGKLFSRFRSCISSGHVRVVRAVLALLEFPAADSVPYTLPPIVDLLYEDPLQALLLSECLEVCSHRFSHLPVLMTLMHETSILYRKIGDSRVIGCDVLEERNVIAGLEFWKERFVSGGMKERERRWEFLDSKPPSSTQSCSNSNKENDPDSEPRELVLPASTQSKPSPTISCSTPPRILPPAQSNHSTPPPNCPSESNGNISQLPSMERSMRYSIPIHFEASIPVSPEIKALIKGVPQTHVAPMSPLRLLATTAESGMLKNGSSSCSPNGWSLDAGEEDDTSSPFRPVLLTPKTERRQHHCDSPSFVSISPHTGSLSNLVTNSPRPTARIDFSNSVTEVAGLSGEKHLQQILLQQQNQQQLQSPLVSIGKKWDSDSSLASRASNEGDVAGGGANPSPFFCKDKQQASAAAVAAAVDVVRSMEGSDTLFKVPSSRQSTGEF